MESWLALLIRWSYSTLWNSTSTALYVLHTLAGGWVTTAPLFPLGYLWTHYSVLEVLSIKPANWKMVLFFARPLSRRHSAASKRIVLEHNTHPLPGGWLTFVDGLVGRNAQRHKRTPKNVSPSRLKAICSYFHFLGPLPWEMEFDDSPISVNKATTM